MIKKMSVPCCRLWHTLPTGNEIYAKRDDASREQTAY